MNYGKGKVRSVLPRVVKSRRFRVLSIALLVIIIAIGLLMPLVESQVASATILTEGDGVYFAITTVTGVGYGDLVPVTGWGKVLTVVLQTVGVVMFGSIVAMVAVQLLRYQEDYYAKRMFERLNDTEEKVEKILKHVDFLVKK